MTITTTPVQTFGSMLQLLRSRCGLHATIGATPALNDILTEAHEYVYEQLDNGFPITDTITLAANVATYEWVADIDSVPIVRGSVQEVWIEQGSQDRVPLLQGISHAQRAFTDMRAIPQRYDDRWVGDPAVWTLEVWPTPDQAYTVYVDHDRVLTKFNADADVPSAPYRLVMQYATAMGKAHYKRADAEVAGQAFKVSLGQAKYRQKERRRFVPDTAFRQRRPRIVGTAGNYRQVWD